ncbi:vivapain-3 (VP3) [Plasmodium ovale wallikeri]|uniref:Vivapain-3 (VP3) n=2 Tax=Plasmodium ovale TaxID=36330 RepID=A0A1A8YVN0_PLAOA|nr:vivapain-3 (VP3) [Plasmodium ovale wallikeri]SBT35504.1 vivapain-3 (VP3) [Plasmodium ovale wallikeri]SBT77034.1 vivapain-3, putative [Plasmodium ovale]
MDYHMQYFSNESTNGEMEVFVERENDNNKVFFKKKKNLFIILYVSAFCAIAYSIVYFSKTSKKNNVFTDSSEDIVTDDYIISSLLKSKNGKKYIVSKIEELISFYDKNGDFEKGEESNKVVKTNACKNNRCVTAHRDNSEDLRTEKQNYNVNFFDTKFLMRNLESVNAFYIFMKEHGKKYTSADEMEKKFISFSKNIAKIEAHNKSNSLYKKGVNRFSDLSFEEFQKKYLTLKEFDLKKSTLNKSRSSDYEDIIIKYKTDDGKFNYIKHDWRELSGVTPIRDQLNCGSCWAFSTVGVVESQYAIRRKQMLSLSEQELVDCSFQNYGCDGGLIVLAFDDMLDLGGLCTAEDYPYVDVKPELCDIYKCKNKYEIKTYAEIPQVRFKEALSFLGPISVSINVTDDFIYYKSGIFDGSCSYIANHAVILVGYGMEEIYNNQTKQNEKQYYYIIKNSWGEQWGEKGFMRIKTDEFGLEKTCSLGAQAFIALIE